MKGAFIVLFAVACNIIAISAKPSRDRISSIMSAINSALRSKGGPYSEYSCKEVSWDDGDRGTVDGALSVWGASITDTRLWEKNGARLFTVRSDNWNEKLGKIKASDIHLIVGNNKANGILTGITLDEFLKNAGKYGSYAGLDPSKSLWNDEMDNEVSIRFQTTFLPVDDKQKSTLEFATEAYNYNTLSDEDPKNVVLLATTQGIAVQQDGEGAKKLFHHRVDENGIIHRHWLEAERTKHKVGGSQKETDAEKIDAKARGKATAKLIGIPAMGTRFNVLMTIQIPLKQTTSPLPPMGGAFGGFGGGGYIEDGNIFAGPPFPAPMAAFGRPASGSIKKKGESNAARVSIGSEEDTWDGLAVEDPIRHSQQHLTATVVLYNTVAGGVPKPEDVVAAIDDMENLYKACNWSGHLADKGANFAKTELTNKTLNEIGTKIIVQPYQPAGVDVNIPEIESRRR